MSLPVIFIACFVYGRTKDQWSSFFNIQTIIIFVNEAGTVYRSMLLLADPNKDHDFTKVICTLLVYIVPTTGVLAYWRIAYKYWVSAKIMSK